LRYESVVDAPGQDFELYELPSTNRYARRQEPDRERCWGHTVECGLLLTQDLELNTLLRAMAGGDEFLFTVCTAITILTGCEMM